MLITFVTTDDENDSMEDVILVMDLWWIWSILATYMLTHYSTTSLTCSNVPMIHFHHHHVRFYGAISNHLISIQSPIHSYLKNAESIDSHDFNFSIISKYQCNIEWFIHLQFMIWFDHPYLGQFPSTFLANMFDQVCQGQMYPIQLIFIQSGIYCRHILRQQCDIRNRTRHWYWYLQLRILSQESHRLAEGMEIELTK